MHLYKQGGHGLLEKDPKRPAHRIGDAPRPGGARHGRRSQVQPPIRCLEPADFGLSRKRIDEAIARLDPQLIADTEFRDHRFAQAQLATMLPLGMKSHPGVILGQHPRCHRWGATFPGGRYPMFGSAQMSIIPARRCRRGQHLRVHAAGQGQGLLRTAHRELPCHRAGADRIFVLGGVPAMAMMAFGVEYSEPVDIISGAGSKYMARGEAPALWTLRHRPPGRAHRNPGDRRRRPIRCWWRAICSARPNTIQTAGWRGLLSEAFAQAWSRPKSSPQLAVLPTRDTATLSWRDRHRDLRHRDRDEAIAISDDWAPEHLDLHLQPDDYLGRLRNYGSLLHRQKITVAYGDDDRRQ